MATPDQHGGCRTWDPRCDARLLLGPVRESLPAIGRGWRRRARWRRAATARSKSALLLGSVVDRVQDVIGLGALAGIGALLAPRALDETSRRIFIGFAALVGVAVVIGALSLRFFPAQWVPFRVRRLLVRVREATRSTASRPQALVVAFSLGLALQTSLIVLNWQLGRLIGIDIPLHVWLFVWPLAKIAGLTPLTQGGIGSVKPPRPHCSLRSG
jgi:hypothetical protein